MSRERLAGDLDDVAAVVALHATARFDELFRRQIAHMQGDLLEAGDLQALAVLEGLHEGRGLEQRIGRAGVEPGESAAEPFDVQGVVLEIDAVEVGDLVLATRARLQRGSDIADVLVVEIEPRHGVMRLGIVGLFLEREGAAVRIEFDHAEPLRIADGIGEHRGPVRPGRGPLEHRREALAVKHVVAEHERRAGAVEKAAADHERLGEAIGARLLGIRERNTKPGAVAQEPLEMGQVVRRGDHEDLAKAREHERRERVVDHRLVVDRQELLRDGERHRMQPCAGAAGEHDALRGRLRHASSSKNGRAGRADTASR